MNSHHHPAPAWRRLVRHAHVLLLCSALGACSHLPASKPEAPHPGTATALPTEWQGRMSLLIQSEPPQHVHASFALQGSTEEGSLTLTTPLGSVAAQAQWRPGSATLEQAGRQQHFGSLAEMLERTSLGNTPVTALFAWLQGRPETAEGWQVDLSQHANGRIIANRQYPPPSAEIKIVVDQY